MKNLTKRNILWVVPILIIVFFWFQYGPKDEITDNEYISYIKQNTYAAHSKTFEEAFSKYCEKGKWVYFQTSKWQNVVEFKGTCPNGNSKSKINLQFIVDKDRKEFKIGALLLDGEQQSNENRDKFINQVFSYK